MKSVFLCLAFFAVILPLKSDDTVAPDKRAFGVMPNYKTVEPDADVKRLSTKEKFTIAAKDTFDWPIFFVSGALSGIAHAQNSNPSFGQGLKGYGHRYVTGYADQVITTIGVEGIFPTVFRQDPRYFRKGTGSGASRTLYAVSRVLVGRTDSGHRTFNFPEVLGNGYAAGIGNLYYRDSTTGRDNLSRFTTLISADALGNVLKEFWPDVKRKFLTKHPKTNP